MSVFPWVLYLVVVLALSLIGWARESRRKETHAAQAKPHGRRVGHVRRGFYSDADLLALAIQASDAVIQNLDTLNLGGLALCALPVALIVLIVDEVHKLPQSVGFVVLVLSFAAIVSSYLGYEWGNRFSRDSVHDSIDIARFVGAYTGFGDPAVVEAFNAVNDIAANHRRLRTEKRRFITVAMALFAIALAVFVSCRLLVVV